MTSPIDKPKSSTDEELVSACATSNVLGYGNDPRNLEHWHTRGLAPVEGPLYRGRSTVAYRRADLTRIVELRAAEIQAATAPEIAAERIANMRERLANTPLVGKRRRESAPERRAPRSIAVTAPSNLPTTCVHSSDPGKADPKTCTRCFELGGAALEIERHVPGTLKLGKAVVQMALGFDGDL